MTLFIVGGCSLDCERGALSSIETISLEEKDDQITLIQSNWGYLTVPRRSPSVFSTTTGGLLVLGGCEAPGKHLNSSEIFRMGEKSVLKSYPEMEENSCAAYCSLGEGQGLVVGGFNGRDCLKQVAVVNLESQRMRKLPDFCSRLKNSVALPVDTATTLFIGGWDEKETSKVVFSLKLEENLDSYDWKMSHLLPYPVEGHGAVLYQNSVFIVGGYDGIHVRNTIVRLDLKSGQKEVLSLGLDCARENHVCALLLEQYLVVAGGWDGQKALDSIEIFKILDSAPFLERIPGNFQLLGPRNRPGVAVSQSLD